MSYGQQPQGWQQTGNQMGQPQQTQYGQYNQYGPYGAPQGAQPSAYTAQAQQQYAQQAAYGQRTSFPQQGVGADLPVDAQVSYSTERAMRVSVARAYGEMAIGLLVTAMVAVLSHTSGLTLRFLLAAGQVGWFALIIAQVALVAVLAYKAMRLSPTVARTLFYVYAATTGFTLSSIFLIYDLGSIGIALGLSVGFFLALTMLAMTTRIDMLKAGPILFVALIVLIVGELVIGLLMPSSTAIMAVSAIGLLIFAGLTVYDAQKTRSLFAQYAHDPQTIKSLSIVCALNLYLDFINMFLHLLRIFGSSRD